MTSSGLCFLGKLEKCLAERSFGLTGIRTTGAKEHIPLVIDHHDIYVILTG
jgi:hypothetical protein